MEKGSDPFSLRLSITARALAAATAAFRPKQKSVADTPVILGRVPSDNVELVQRAAEALMRGDVEGVMEVCTADVLWLPGRSALQGGYTGASGMQKWLADNVETFEVFTATWNETFD